MAEGKNQENEEPKAQPKSAAAQKIESVKQEADAASEQRKADRAAIPHKNQKQADETAKNAGEAQKRGASHEETGTGGLSVGPEAMRRGGVTVGGPQPEEKTEQQKLGIEPNSSGEDRLNLKAQKAVMARYGSVAEDGTIMGPAMFGEDGKDNERNAEILDFDSDVQSAFTGRVGVSAPLTAPGDITRTKHLAPETFNATQLKANDPNAYRNNVVIETIEE